MSDQVPGDDPGAEEAPDIGGTHSAEAREGHSPATAPEGDAIDSPTESEETGLAAVALTPSQLADEIEALKRERDALRDQLLRRRADFENLRKRVDRDREQAGIEVEAAIWRALLPTLDNLDRASQSEASPTSLREGIELIRRDLRVLMQTRGAIVHDPLGQRFDPNRDQALSQEETAEIAEGTVVEVFRKGYFFRDRLLRPALVKVAKAPEAETAGLGARTVH